MTDNLIHTKNYFQILVSIETRKVKTKNFTSSVQTMSDKENGENTSTSAESSIEGLPIL